MTACFSHEHDAVTSSFYVWALVLGISQGQLDSRNTQTKTACLPLQSCRLFDSGYR